MKKIWAFITAICLLAGSGLTAYADQTKETAESEVPEQNETARETTLECTFSEPVIMDENGKNVYKSTLILQGADALEGYQIEVKAENEDSIVIENKLGGTATKNVFKDGAQHLAVMTGKMTGSNQELCEITVSYPFRNHPEERTLEVTRLDIVTSVSEEAIWSGGPYTLQLPYAEPPFYANIKFYLILAGLTAAGAGLFILYRRRRRIKQISEAAVLNH